MKALLLSLSLVCVLGAAPVTQPAPASVPAVAATSPSVNHGIPLDPKSAVETVKAAAETAKAVEQFVGAKETDNTKKALAIMGIVALVLKLLLSLLKTVTPFFKANPKAAIIIRISTLVVGVLVFFVSQMALGLPWFDALIAAIGGPVAIALHELGPGKLFMRGDEKAEEPKEAPKDPNKQ